MTSEQMTVARVSSDLPHQIKKPERNQRAPGNDWKGFPNSAVDRHAAPHDEHPQCNCEKHVAGSGYSGNRERLRLVPMLRPRRDYKRQPMRGDGSMKECDGKPCKNKGNEDEIIHLQNNLTISLPALPVSRFESCHSQGDDNRKEARGIRMAGLRRDSKMEITAGDVGIHGGHAPDHLVSAGHQRRQQGDTEYGAMAAI